MKKIFSVIFCLFFLIVLISCAKAPLEEKNSPEKEDVLEQNQITAEEEIPSQTMQESPSQHEEETPEHSHQWQVYSFIEGTCSSSGERVWNCSCGQSKKESISALSHDFPSFSCTEGGVCRRCGIIGNPLGHQMEKNKCVRCGKIETAPIFVLGKALFFDQTFDSILATLGSPTEILREGDMQSLIFATDPSRLTVVQLDPYGLWGVFTFDPQAFFQIDDTFVSPASFSGSPDPESDASYRDFSSCRIYAFSDSIGSGKNYAMWMRYSECDYHYMFDPRISQDLFPQARLSFYYVNALRALSGLSPIHWCEKASEVSFSYSKKMAEEDFFYHDGLYGNRLSEKGILWRGSGENISQGYTSSYFVCDAYYNCIDHRNNILNPSFSHIGIGYHIKFDSSGPLAVLGAQTFYY